MSGRNTIILSQPFFEFYAYIISFNIEQKKEMIKQGDRITNARTRQTMIFLQTGAETDGKLLQMECFSPPTAVEEPEHIHPLQESIVTMISGSLHFSVDGKEHIVATGESLSIPPNVRHYFRNSGDTVAHYIAEFKPALTIDSFFETFFALSRGWKTE